MGGSKSQRDKILASKDPCVIIASSGMLTGGVSPIYAERILEDEKNLLAIVGTRMKNRREEDCWTWLSFKRMNGRYF